MTSRRSDYAFSVEESTAKSSLIDELSVLSPSISAVRFVAIAELTFKLCNWTLLASCCLGASSRWLPVHKLPPVQSLGPCIVAYTESVSFSSEDIALVVTAVLFDKSTDAERYALIEASLVKVFIREVQFTSPMRL